MDIQARKLEFIREFLNLRNEELLSLLEKLLHSGEMAEEKMKSMDLKELYRRIDQSMEDSENGKLVELQDLLSEIDTWS